MSKILTEAQYVCDLTKDDIALHMADLACAVGIDHSHDGRPDSYAQEALDNLQSLTVAVHVWAKAQRKIEKASQCPEVRDEASSITPQMKATSLKSMVGLV